jgi:hypothetical protein
MAAKKKTPVKTRRTKIEDVKSDIDNQPLEDSKTKSIKTARKVAVKSSALELSEQKIAESLAKSSVEISKALAGVGDECRNVIVTLEELKEAKDILEEELSELYDKEVILKSRSELILEHENTVKELKKNLSDLKDKISEEERFHAEKVIAREEKLNKDRKRENEDYEYNLKIARRNQQDQWKETIIKNKRDLADYEETKRKEWEQREETISKKESEIADKIDILNNIDNTINEAVTEAVAKSKKEVYAELGNKHKHETVALTHKLELCEIDKQNLTSQLIKSQSEVDRLNNMVGSLQSKVEEMAREAIRAQSGRDALEAVQSAVEKTSHKK